MSEKTSENQAAPATTLTAAISTREPVGIRLENVSKRFRGGVEAIKDVTLAVAPGEFVVLVGPSGCGKSTLLRVLAGLEEVSSGRIHIGDKDVTTQLPQQRDVAMVFQSYALYPRMSVRGNIGFGLRMRGIGKDERRRRVEEVAQVLGLEHLLDRRPAALSGGQRQRVAMGRAIVREPQVFLMDEPLSNLDAKLRVSMRAQLTLLHKRLGVTTVYVTHDQTEAMTLGQRVAVLRDGVLQQVDTPQQLFHHPVNLFVAAFIGSPSMNFVHATVSNGAASFAGVRIPVRPDSPLARGDRKVIVGVRPTSLSLASGNGQPELAVTPAIVEDLGDERFVIFDVDAPRVDTEATRAAVEAQAADDALLVPLDRATFTARLPAGTPVTVGEPITVALDPDRLHFFDPATGASLEEATSLTRGASSR
ncbi:sn-glycerol-3-phosphate ABC transporter ATP-binding protein UgpC [Jiangella aurantiaca]|uniref:sn-glycerol-3-phosphate ABC transporter ATP-binding protein UgpC n=1 Tax=Jiangella aurantiaca TaxID=2530373 RepID=A0A4R4ZY37_9ACTN|nr:sn-glycerol-3-phosphate ABC transporter ATP-binding protein UgpC [Jiangella aurantiaca]TDD64171.1 sn-glycerol-3-phosphate ABC transporter ATP-binding protein UgpC [Jiangella aurantiaca]